MLEKLPQALKESPSTSPLTNPQMMRRMSVYAVLMFARKCLDRAVSTGCFSVRVPWFPDRDTVVLPPTDHIPAGSLVSSSNRDIEGDTTVCGSQYIIWLLFAVAAG